MHIYLSNWFLTNLINIKGSAYQDRNTFIVSIVLEMISKSLIYIDLYIMIAGSDRIDSLISLIYIDFF